jgi:hypothetical protein
LTSNWWRSERTRKFLREVGSVVLGVLVALALGAVASEIGWRIEVAEARGALAEEMGEVLGQARERERLQSCFDRKLDAVAAIVDKAALDGRLPPVGDLGDPLVRTWSRGVWDSTQNAETAAHFDRETLDNLSGVYEFVDRLNRINERELDLWTRLYTIVGPGRPIGEEEVAGLRQTISDARAASNLMSLFGVRIQQVVDAFGLPYDRDVLARYGDRSLANVPVCHPISTVIPPGYGQAPLQQSAVLARRNPITRNSAGFHK